MDATESTGVRHDVGLDGDSEEPLVRCWIIGDEQQVIGNFTQGVGHSVDDATPFDALEALGQAAVPGCRAPGEDHTGVGKSH